MNGNDIYINKYNNKINNIINNNPDIIYLKGFYNYMDEQSESTKYNYINYAVNFIRYINKNASDIEFDDYTDFLSTIQNKSSSYRISVYSGLKLFSNYLYNSNKNANNHMSKIKRPKMIESIESINKREEGYLNTKEIHKYINNINDGIGNSSSIKKQNAWKERDYAIIMIFLNTGIRCAGLYKLDVDSIDITNKTLTTVEKRNKIRVYDLTEEVIDAINKWIDKRTLILDGENNEIALFISNRKSRLDQQSIYAIVNKYAGNIEGKHITPHKLRATYGTQLYNKTKDIYFVQECMGHASPKTTERYIRGNKAGNTKRASEIMSAITFSK